MKLRYLFVILFVAVAGLACGCIFFKDPIIGTWTHSSSFTVVSMSSSIVFNDDGTFDVQGQAAGFSATASGGTWKKTGDGTYSLSGKGWTMPVTMSKDMKSIFVGSVQYTKQ